MLFSWCCRWFFPITSPAVQELDRKVTMAEQIATMRYLMNAFTFWFMIFFLPPAKFRFFLFPQISLRRSTLRNDSFRGLESWFHYFCFLKSLAVRIVVVVLSSCAPSFSFFRPFLFPQLGRYFSPTGQVILRAFWITMQRYEIPIYQVCDSVRYHAIAEHFLQNTHHLTLNIQHWKSPRSQRFYRWSVTRQVNINHSPLSRFPEVIENSLHLLGRERLASLFISHLLQFIPERLATPNPTHEMIHGRAWHTLGKVHQSQFLLRIRTVYKIFHNLNFLKFRK